MTQEELQQKIAEYYHKLPDKAKHVFASKQWLSTLRNISARTSLSQEQTEVLAVETTLILLGIINREEYERVLSEQLGLNRDKLNNILEEINLFVISPIAIEINNAFNKNSNGVVEAAAPKTEEPLDKKIEKEHLVKGVVDPRFEKLPENIKKIVVESDYPAKIYVLARESGLTLSQITTLEDIVTDTIVGTTPSSMFETRAMSIGGMDANKLKLLVEEINEKILKDIKRKILALEQKTKGEAFKTESYTAPTPITNTSTENTQLVANNQKQSNIGNKEVKTETNSNNNSNNSIAFQKLSGAFKNIGTTTEYSLNNISKNGNTVTKVSPAEPPKADPYRMPIE